MVYYHYKDLQTITDISHQLPKNKFYPLLIPADNPLGKYLF